jgi:diguanylate cyclase (GGDEF)-like protein
MSRFDRLTRRTQHVVAGLLIILIFVIDWMTGPEIALSIFYVIPVALLGWQVGARSATVCACLCGLAWLGADYLAGQHYSVPAIMYWNGGVRLGLFLIIGQTLSQLRRSVEEEQRIARTDSLTGIANGKAFLEAVTYEVTRQRRYLHPLSVAFVDCDNFKEVNDQFGHAAGDELLRSIAAKLKSTLRDVDVIARVGGDEFAVLLPESDELVADSVCGKLRETLSFDTEYPVTFSLGMVTYYSQPADAEEVVRNADLAMYEAKKSGKNASRHHIFGENKTSTHRLA